MLKKTKIDTTTTNTIIGEGVKIEGAKITGKGSIRIDGTLLGELELSGNVIVGENGSIEGNIKVDHALIAGTLQGNVICREGIHLAPTAKLTGNIEATSLIIDDGAIFSGVSAMNVNSPERNDPKSRIRIKPELFSENGDQL